MKTEWSEENVYPGTPVTFLVLSEADSPSVISATDKIIELLRNDNNVTSETIRKL